jgi:hypothetical protein
MSKIEVDAIEPQSGTTLTLGASGDTINVASGATNNLGITEADQWRLTASLTMDLADTTITANLEQVDNATQGTIGTGMTESSGVFSFPSTGIWNVVSNHTFFLNGDSRFLTNIIQATTNNSTYSDVGFTYSFIQQTGSSTTYANSIVSSLIDVTDISNVKVRFQQRTQASGTQLYGATDANHTFFTFIRLGDT